MIALDKEILPKVMRSAQLPAMIKYWMLRRIFSCLEAHRSRLISGRELDEEEWHFVSAFRLYLETGDEENLPLVLEMERELTVAEFRRDIIFACNGNCGCPFDEVEAPWLERSRQRRSRFGIAAREK